MASARPDGKKSFSLGSWKALWPRWSKIFVMNSGDPWICLKPGSVRTGLGLAGCRPCAKWLHEAQRRKLATPANDKFAEMNETALKSTLFQQHHGSTHHGKCESWLLGLAKAHEVNTPANEAFEAVLKHVQSGGAFGKDGLRDVPGAGSGEKCRHMVRCLAEAPNGLTWTLCIVRHLSGQCETAETENWASDLLPSARLRSSAELCCHIALRSLGVVRSCRRPRTQ